MAEGSGDGGSGGEKERRVPDEVVTTVGDLRRWTATLPSEGESRERHEPRRELADAVVEALYRRMLGENAAAAFEALTSLVVRETDVLRAIDDVWAARDALHRRLVLTLPPELAYQAVEELNELADAVLREATDHAVRHLHDDAFTDVLTGAANRRAFERDFHRALETAKRHERQLAVAIIDLDGLKRLNDEQGHGAGDQALRDLAIAFEGHLRAGDGLYRIGGDEFALLMPESGAPAVEALLARARLTAPSFSHGWAAHPDDGETSTDLLQRADERLLRGRHVRRTTPSRPVPARVGSHLQLAAATVPVLVALGLAELVRRMIGVELGSVLLQSWVGLLVLGGLLGPPVARRWCTGQADVTTTTMCATRVGSVVLLILVLALVPVSRLREAIDVAAFRNTPIDGTLQSIALGGSSGPTATSSAAPSAPAEVAIGPLESAGASTRQASISRRPPISAPSASTALGLAPPAPDPSFLVPIESAPTAGIGTKTPNDSLDTRPLARETLASWASPTGARPHGSSSRSPIAKKASASSGGGVASKPSAGHRR